MIKTEAQKILKIIEIQNTWNVKAKVVLVINRVTGTISKSFRQYLSNLLGKLKIKELQKTVILDTTHILGQVLMYKYKTYFTREITLHAAQIVNREQLQHYIP